MKLAHPVAMHMNIHTHFFICTAIIRGSGQNSSPLIMQMNMTLAGLGTQSHQHPCPASFASLIVLNYVFLSSADLKRKLAFSKHIEKRIIAKTFKSFAERTRKINVNLIKQKMGNVN